MTNRAIRTQQNKELIITTAGKLFRKKGVEGTTMADIVRETGLSNGTIYHIFKSKQDILRALYAYYFDRDFGICDGLEEKIKDPMPTVQKFLLDYERTWSNLGWSFALHIYREGTSERGKRVNSSPKRELSRLIKSAQEAGTATREFSSEDIADTLFVIGRGLVFRWSSEKGVYDLVEDSLKYWEMLLPTFFK